MRRPGQGAKAREAKRALALAVATVAGVCCLLAALAVGCGRDDASDIVGSQAEPLGNPVTISITTPPALSPTAAVINATNFVSVGPAATLQGPVVSLGSTAGISVGPQSQLTDVWSQGPAVLGPQDNVTGTLHAAVDNLSPGDVVAHFDRSPIFSPARVLSWSVTIPTGATANKHITAGGTGSLSPGAFQDVTVDARGTLALKSGTYFIVDLSLAVQSTVTLDQAAGPVLVYVTGKISLGGTFVPLHGGAPNLLIAYLGTGALSVGGSSGAPFAGSIVAPNTQLSLMRSSAAHAGFFAAQNITVGPQATVKFSPPIAIIGMGSSDAGADSGDASDAAHESGEAGDSGDGGDASEGSVVPTCGVDAGSPPTPPACGNGWVDPGEECDSKGLGAACSKTCQVDDFLAVQQRGADGGLSNPARTLGTGRHPIAAAFDNTFAISSLDLDHLTLTLSGFNPSGVPLGPPVSFSTQSTVVQDSAQVIAALPCDHRYAAAWAQLGAGAGDELDIALRIVDPTTPPMGAPTVANATLTGTQRAPDILTVGNQIVVAWEDDSNPATAPDVMLRTFDANLNPTSAEQTLAGTTDSEADVALTPFGSSWAAAWRDDANGLETVRVQAGTTQWSIQPSFLPAPVGVKPALVSLDPMHLLVVYAVGVDRTDSGVANGSKLQTAVLNVATPGSQVGTDLPGTVAAAAGLDQSQPATVTVQGGVFVTWWTAGAPGNASGEELWLKQVPWNGAALDTTKAEKPLPRWPQAQLGDQRLPALAASTLPPGGALVAAWDDLGRTIATGEGPGDVVVELAPVPVLRTGSGGGP